MTTDNSIPNSARCTITRVPDVGRFDRDSTECETGQVPDQRSHWLSGLRNAGRRPRQLRAAEGGEVRHDLIVGDVPSSATRRLISTRQPIRKRLWWRRIGRRSGVERAAPLGAVSAICGPRLSPEYDLSRIEVKETAGSLAYYIVLAFIGGIILNLMPCVLPVIGLKVMSFVEQAGHSRTHALVLNLWYSAGIVSVFLLLGFLAAWIGLSWGGQFGSTAFTVTLAAIVFAMALSLLGVWEIPIPGFFGSGAVQDAAAKEGPSGAFLKGAITTVLATPCTGPFMASAIAWAVTQSTSTTLIVFGTLGLGMASPYLLIGVFPELLRFLPKPGQWMETFKQITGFILLATVVFMLSFMEPTAVVPTVALLLGVGLACWLVSRTPLTAELSDRLQSWALAGAVVLLAAVVSFGWLFAKDAHVDWQPFSLEKLQQVAVDDGRTVLVDFSADWCITCKALEKTVLHTERVQQAIANSGQSRCTATIPTIRRRSNGRSARSRATACR